MQGKREKARRAKQLEKGQLDMIVFKPKVKRRKKNAVS